MGERTTVPRERGFSTAQAPEIFMLATFWLLFLIEK